MNQDEDSSVDVVTTVEQQPPPPPPIPPANGSSHENCLPLPHQYRYIPPIASISLQSDAPGYYENPRPVDDRDTVSPPSRVPVEGPICWKCRGTGQKRNQPMKQSNAVTTATTTTTTTAAMNHNHQYNCCTVCCGRGRIRRPVPSLNTTGTNPEASSYRIPSDANTKESSVGMITRGRRRRRLPDGIPSPDRSIRHRPQHMDPVGYSIPYFGSLVQRATTECTDVRIRYDNPDPNDTHNKTGTRPTIRQVEIGNPIKDRNASDTDTTRNKPTTCRDDDDHDTTNPNVPTSIVQQVPNNVESLPLWLPIYQADEQLCNFVGDWRILQRRNSHRYTTDDVVTAVVACRDCFRIRPDHPPPPTTNNKNEKEDGGRIRPVSYCDLGTGNGSVLQMILWKVLESSPSKNEADPPFHCVYGFEARTEAVELLRRSLDFNIGTDTHLRNKVTIVRTDFRSYCHDPLLAPVLQNQFDVVTGTPPYFQVDFHIPVSSSSSPPPSSSSSLSNFSNTDTNSDSRSRQHSNSDTVDTATATTTTPIPNVGSTNITATIRQGGMPLSIQSAPARCEFRGGIEDYCRTASYLLKPGSGQFCVCENYSNHQRTVQSFRTHHLLLIKYYMIEGKVGRGPLFCVYVARKKADHEEDDLHVPPPDIVRTSVRDGNGEWTDAYKRLVLEYMSMIY